MLNIRNTVPTLLLATALTTAPVSAQDDIEELKKQLAMLAAKIEKLEAKQEKAPVVKKAEPAMSLATADGQFEMNIRGRIYTDYVTASDKNDTMDVSGTEFRTARIGVEGKAWKTTKYKFEADLSDNDVSIKDAYMEFSAGVGKVTVGQFKTPNSLDEQTSSRHIAFLERGSFTDAFSLGRQTGIKWSNSSKNYTAALGVFKGSISDDGQGDMTLAGRATYGDTYDGGTWMVGGSFRHRETDSNRRYRQRPHVHLSDRFVDTKSTMATDDFFVGVEAAVQHGSFYGSAEYASLSAKEASLSTAGGNATMHGGYIDIGYFLTGEKRPLKTDKGSWDRPAVNNPIQEGGMGAISLNMRYDMIDLTGDGIYGGEMDTYILGMNWYLNRHTRIVTNYSHSSISKGFAVSANGPTGKNSVDALGVRFQVDW